MAAVFRFSFSLFEPPASFGLLQAQKDLLQNFTCFFLDPEIPVKTLSTSLISENFLYQFLTQRNCVQGCGVVCPSANYRILFAVFLTMQQKVVFAQMISSNSYSTPVFLTGLQMPSIRPFH